MYKFFSSPLREIKSKKTGGIIFKFDTKGEFITDDPIIIERALGFFDYIEIKEGEKTSKVEKTFIEPTIKIESNLNQKEETLPFEEVKEEKLMKCNQCDFETDNKGLLMAHYRKHKKEDK